MMRIGDWKNFEKLGWTVFIALLFIIVHGYTFNCGDQEEHLPYVYRLLNHDLYQHDYIVPLQTSNFTVRFFFAWLLYGFGCIFPMAISVFTLYFICLCTIIYFTGRISELCSEWKYSFVIGPFLAFILLNTFTIGANTLFDNQLTCSCFASALGCIALYKCMVNRLYIAGALAGVASLFQVLIGLHLVLLIMVIIMMNNNNNKIKKILVTVLSYLIFSAAMLIPILMRQSALIAPSDVELYNNILFKFRNAHHYLPSYFPIKDFVKTIFYWSIILLISLINKSKWNNMVIALMLFVSLGCLLYWIGFEQLEFSSIGKLQWFKATGWITLISVIPATRFLVQINWFNSISSKIISGMRIVIWPISILILVLLSNTSFIPINKIQYRYQIGNYQNSDLAKMHNWIAANTPKTCVILPLPDDDSFMCEAQRSIPVGYKAIIHEPFFLLPWYRKFNAIYGVGLLENEKDQRVVERADLLYPTRADSVIKSDVLIDYRIWNISRTSIEMLRGKTIIHQEGNYIFCKFG